MLSFKKIYPFVPAEEIEAHEKRVRLEHETERDPDVLSPRQEDEWNISLRIRAEAAKTLDIK